MSVFIYFYATDYGIRPTINSGAKNVILVVVNGMGKGQTEAAGAGETTVFGGMSLPFSGMVDTRSLSLSATDLNAAASAFSTGEKVKNGRLSYRKDKDLKTLAETAKKLGKKVGVITDGYAYEGMAGALSAHNKGANKDATVMEQISGGLLDVLIGRGAETYDRYEDDILTESRDYCNDYEAEFLTSRKDSAFFIYEDEMPLTGFFTLSTALSNVIHILDNEDGYLLVVEDIKVAEAGIAGDMAKTLEYMKAVNEAIRVALAAASADEDTTVIVTSGYDAGALDIGNASSAGELDNSMFKKRRVTVNDVPWYGRGPGAYEIPRKIDNTDFYYIIKQLLENY